MKLNSIIPTIAAIVLGVFLISNIVDNNKLVKILTDSKDQFIKESIEHHKADSINSLYLSKLEENKITISKLETSYNKTKNEVIKLRTQLNATLDSIDKEVPYDSSYVYLQKKYPFVGEEKYPFNGPQVKQFHKLSVQENWDLITISRLGLAVTKADSVIKTKDIQLGYYSTLYTNCQADGNLYKKENIRLTGEYNKTNDKLNKVKLARNIISGGLVVFVGIEVLKIIL